MGIDASAVILATGLLYAITLGLGFASLASPDQPIGNPYFTILECLILAMAPAMVALMVSVNARVPARHRAFGLAALCFMVMLAIETCSVHFVILTLSNHPGFAGDPVMARLLGFQWPSAAYALDILGWDVFFALSMLFAAPAFEGGGICRAICIGMIISGILALAGLAGVPVGNMAVRDIGIAGYLGTFLIVDALLLALFVWTKSIASTPAALDVPLSSLSSRGIP